MDRIIDYTRPSMTHYQLEIMDCEERFACIEASTKAGKTASMIVWLFEEALKIGENQGVDWIAPVFGQSRIAFERMKAQISDRNFFKVNEQRLLLTLPHGAMIRFKSGDNPDSLYGDDCYAAVMDEASRQKEAAYIAVRSTLTKTKGKLKMIGNVKGRKNFFYKLSMRAKAKEPGYFYKKITAYDAVEAGILDLQEIEDAKRDLPEAVFKELYLAEASEDGSNPIGLAHISRAVYDMSPDPPVCFGIDLAKGKNPLTGDWTVITGLDRFGRVCHFDRFQRDWDSTTKAILSLPPGPICIDSTGSGDPIAESISRVRETEMFVFTQRSKQQLIEGLAYAIQNREVTVLDGIMKDELDSFEYEYSASGVKYTAPYGLHDDCVCSLALAVRIHRTAKAFGDISVW